MAARLVACMLEIKDVDEDETKRIVEANTSGSGAGGGGVGSGGAALLPGRTACCWDDEPEPTWSHHVESLLDLPALPAIDPSAASESDPAAVVEKPRARMLPHDEPELIAGTFTTMIAPIQKVLPDPSFHKERGEPDSPSSPNGTKFPPLKGAK